MPKISHFYKWQKYFSLMHYNTFAAVLIGVQTKYESVKKLIEKLFRGLCATQECVHLVKVSMPKISHFYKWQKYFSLMHYNSFAAVLIGVQTKYESVKKLIKKLFRGMCATQECGRVIHSYHTPAVNEE